MKVTDEMLMALADRELDAETEAALRQRIAADPALAREFEMYQETARILRDEYPLGETPARLIDAINAVEDLSATTSNVVPFRRREVFQWTAIAASLVLAFVAGGQFGSQPDSGLTSYANLATGESVDLGGGKHVRAAGSFETDLGLCRNLTEEAADGIRQEIICRQGDQWYTLMAMNTPASDGYVPANDSATEALDAVLGSIGAGSALAPAAEAEALR